MTEAQVIGHGHGHIHTRVDPAYQVPALEDVLKNSRRTPRRGIQVYGVIRGRATKSEVVEPRGDAPHYHVLVQTTDRQSFDVAVDIFDHFGSGSDVLYRVVTDLAPPPASASAWLALPTGATSIGSAGAGGLGLDYVRQHFVARDQMKILPVDPATIGRTLSGDVADLVRRAIADPRAEFFAFGRLFAGNAGQNPVFGFSPDAGVHDIHLNKGDPGRNEFPFEDGALFVHYPYDNHWEAAFFAFQDQTFPVAAAPNE